MSAVIYVRQSLDRDGTGAAVDRQLNECRALAERSGLTIATEFIDNDVSASKGIRPGFSALLASIRAGQVSTIVVWHTDRLYRRVRDLVDIVEMAEKHALRVLTVRAGDLDLATPAGRMLAGMLGHAARYEVEQKGARQVAANIQRANRGVWQFSNRPYGYQRVDGRVVIVEAEAEVLRNAYRSYLRGETYYAIVERLNTAGTMTLTGLPWTVPQLSSRLANPSYAGIRMYKGEAVGGGDWEPIINEATWADYSRLRSHRKTAHTWSNQTKYLLSGLLTCGVCAGKMLARPTYAAKHLNKAPTVAYVCTANWCVQRNGLVMDAFIEDQVVARFSRPDILELAKPTDAEPLETEALDLRRKWDDLAALVADGTLRPAAVREQVDIIRGKLELIEARIDSRRNGAAFSKLALASDTHAAWAGLGLPDKRRTIATLMSVTVNRQANTRRFDPQDVVIGWLS